MLLSLSYNLIISMLLAIVFRHLHEIVLPAVECVHPSATWWCCPSGRDTSPDTTRYSGRTPTAPMCLGASSTTHTGSHLYSAMGVGIGPSQ